MRNCTKAILQQYPNRTAGQSHQYLQKCSFLLKTDFSLCKQSIPLAETSAFMKALPKGCSQGRGQLVGRHGTEAAHRCQPGSVKVMWVWGPCLPLRNSQINLIPLSLIPLSFLLLITPFSFILISQFCCISLF